MQRTYVAGKITIPPYYLSVAARNLGARKERWKKEKSEGLSYPVVEPWVIPAFDDPEAGEIVKVSEVGEIIASVECEFANGLLLTEGGLLNGQHDAVRRYSPDLKTVEVFSSFPPFNDLHTLRESPEGILISTSGTDSICEISKDGKNLLWSWWATEHGYTTDSFGKERTLDVDADHRNLFYNTWLRTTHVNSAQALPDGSILVTFFHQGIFGKLDRKSGKVTPLMQDLRRPHASRLSGTEHVTFVDTGRGIAYCGTLAGDAFKVEHSVSITSNWLQDGQFVNDMWILADAENARVHFVDRNNTLLAYDQFDPDWDFFEVCLAK